MAKTKDPFTSKGVARGYKSQKSFDKDRFDARFGKGPLVGRTGDPFTDDPFFNPWAPGGSFNK